jgi:SAM-dependent methyltransferase
MLATFVKNCATSVRRHGLGTTAGLYWNRLREKSFEKGLGIRSGNVISLRELGLEHEERREHTPTSLQDFRRMEKFLRPRAQDEVFLDYGAGLGRMLVLAAMLPYKRVIGVELSPVLATRAQENISKCRDKLRCKDIEVFASDAGSFELGPDVTTIYFQNPFAGTILESVLSRIIASYNQNPRALRIVCNLPQESAFFSIMEKADQFMLDKQLDLGAHRRCYVFSIKNDQVIECQR